MKLKLVYNPNVPHGSYVCDAATGERVENVAAVDFRLTRGGQIAELEVTILNPEIQYIPPNPPSPVEPVTKAWPY